MGVIIKSGSTEFSGATVKGNFSYFVDPSIDLGPSDVTGFYSGYEPPSGGYSIYKTASVTGGMVVRTATDSSSLNSVLISFGAPYETIADNIAWADSNNDILIYSGGGGGSYYTWSNYYTGFAPPLVCNHMGEQVTLYTSVTPLDNGVQLYTDNTLTTAFSGSTWFGAGEFATDRYNVNASGIIQSTFPITCGVGETRVGISNVSQLDACLRSSDVLVYWNENDNRLANGTILYQDKYCTIPYTGTSYISQEFNNAGNYEGYGFNVNPSTGAISNKTLYGYYYCTDKSTCAGTGSCNLVDSPIIFSPDTLESGKHYYDGVSGFDFYIYGPCPAQGSLQLHSGYTGPGNSCMCP
jgi:hypothetical protein